MSTQKPSAEPSRTRRSIGRYFAEFLVVFLGVWLSLLAEQYREDRADRRREIQALSAIASDLESDVAWVDATILRARVGLDAAARFLAGGLADSELLEALSEIGICSFTGNQRTSRYEAVRTGELGSVRAGPLRAQVEQLYFNSSTRDYLHARDCDATDRFFAMVAPHADVLVPPLEREDPVEGWGWNDRPIFNGIRDAEALWGDSGLRGHVALIASQRQFLEGWLEREVVNRMAVLEAIHAYIADE